MFPLLPRRRGYRAGALQFDGTDRYLTSDGALVVTDSDKGIFSCWISVLDHINFGDSGRVSLILSSSSPNFSARYAIDGFRSSIRIESRNTAGTSVFQYETQELAITGKYLHFIASWDSTLGLLKAYLNDVVPQHIVSAIGSTGLLVGYQEPTQWTVATSGASPGSDTTNLKASIAEVYLCPGTYLDLDIEANRRKFITRDKRPVYPGEDGSTPTGTVPFIYVRRKEGQNATEFADNKGSGGGFNTTGTLLADTNSPSNRLPYYIGAVDFDLTAHFTKPTGLPGPSNLKKGTVSFWYKRNTDPGVNQYIYSSGISTTPFSFIIWHSSGGQLVLRIYDSAGVQRIDIVSQLRLGFGWEHVMFSWDTTILTSHLWINDRNYKNAGSSIADSANLSYTLEHAFIGCDPDELQLTDSSIADLYIKIGSYLDLSVQGNRRLFESDRLLPIDLGVDGSNPGQGVPDVFLRLAKDEAAANFATNRGSAGDFTVVGTPAYSPTTPTW